MADYSDDSQYISVFLGDVGFEPGAVTEREALPPIGEGYLNQIEYSADIHLPKSTLASMLDNVKLTTAEGPGGADDLDADGNPKSKQIADGLSFNFNRCYRPVGRVDCQLKGKFLEKINPGADDVALGSQVQLVDADGNILASSDCNISMDQADSDATHQNQACATLPKALSAQMPGTGGDENLLRIMVQTAGYENLCKLGLAGSSDVNGDSQSLNALLCSESELAGAEHERSEFASLSSDAPNARPLGHEIMHTLVAADPIGVEGADANVGADKLWAPIYGQNANGESVVDAVTLGDSEQLSKTVVLRFVLDTNLSMTLRGGSSVSTVASPAQIDSVANDKVKILYNIVFDQASSALDLGNGVTVTVDPASKLSIESDASFVVA